MTDSDRDQDVADRKQRARIAADPRYQQLVRRRSRFTWTLTGIMLAVYFGYILLIAFDKSFLAQPLFSGAATSLGIPLGLGVILIAIVLTGIYVRRANTDFDPMLTWIVADSGRQAAGGDSEQ